MLILVCCLAACIACPLDKSLGVCPIGSGGVLRRIVGMVDVRMKLQYTVGSS